jgi:hypothetical protein
MVQAHEQVSSYPSVQKEADILGKKCCSKNTKDLY